MEIEFTHQPSYTHAIVTLDQGESVMAEPGAMVSHSPTIDVETTTSRDGLLSSAKSMLGGESLLANEFTAQGGAGEVSLAPPTPGDIHHHYLENETLYSVDGAFLAAEPGIDIDSEFGGFKSLLAGAGVTPLALRGTGNVLIEAFGGIQPLELGQGEQYTIDNEHVVAWEGSVEFNVRRVGGLKSSLLSGEGLVLDFTGPGTVWYQTRGLDAFASVIADLVPGGDNGGGDEGIGDIV